MAGLDARWWFVITIVTTSMKEVSTGLKAGAGAAGQWKSITMIFTTRSRIALAVYAAAAFFFTVTLLRVGRGGHISHCQCTESKIPGLVVQEVSGRVARHLLDGEGQMAAVRGMLTKRKDRLLRIRPEPM